MRIAVLDTCPVCATQFKRRYKRAGTRKICCSKKCAGALNRKEFTCKTCGSKFFAGQKQKNREYCSQSCMHPRPCLTCGKTIFGYPYGWGTRKDKRFCSRGCSNFYRICREKIGVYVTLGFVACIKRTGRLACERCGTDNVGHLCVHHRDRNRKHNVPSNLEVLCLNCHSDEHNGSSKMRKWEMERVSFILNHPRLTEHIDDWSLK